MLPQKLLQFPSHGVLYCYTNQSHVYLAFAKSLLFALLWRRKELVVEMVCRGYHMGYRVCHNRIYFCSETSCFNQIKILCVNYLCLYLSGYVFRHFHCLRNVCWPTVQIFHYCPFCSSRCIWKEASEGSAFPGSLGMWLILLSIPPEQWPGPATFLLNVLLLFQLALLSSYLPCNVTVLKGARWREVGSWFATLSLDAAWITQRRKISPNRMPAIILIFF